MNKKASKELFIDGTIKSVARVGMENLRTKMVADLAGFSETAMFRYFTSKDDLLCQTFLVIDNKVSGIFLNMFQKADFEKQDLLTITHDIWQQVYRYLIEHGDETLFLIRFRYSALYTNNIRSMRRAYSGSFEHIYSFIDGQLNGQRNIYREFLINYIFELTLCFAEKIVTGRVENSETIESSLWLSIVGAVSVMTQSAEQQQ